MNAAIKLPPHSVESEQAVLGALLLSRAAWHKIQHTLAAEDFYRHDHRLIFEAIARLMTAGEPADVVTVAERMEAAGDLHKAGGLAYIAGLAENTPSAANVEAYAATVARDARIRAAIVIASDLIANPQADDAIDNAIRSLMTLQVARRNYEYTLDEAVHAAIESVEAHAEGKVRYVTTGLADLDKMLGGWRAGDLYVIAARPSIGKTAWIVNSIERANAKAGFVSGEQANEQIGQRMLSVVGRINSHRLRTAAMTDEDWPKMTAAVGSLAKRQLWIYDKSGPSISEVERWARKLKHERDIEVLYLDYLQRIRPDDKRAKRHEQIDDITSRLKDLARDLGIALVSLAQVNRDCEKRENKRPGLGDMADGSAIEKEADVIATLYRDEVYNPQTDRKGVLEVSVLKNRHGPIGTVMAVWRGEFMRVDDLERRYA